MSDDVPDIRLLPFPALHERMRRGDAEAGSEFFRRYEPFMRAVARHWLNPRLRRHADSGDMVQSVFRVALANVREVRFEDERRLRSWLGRVMRNRVLRVARRVRGPGSETIDDLAGGDAVAEGAPDPSDLAEHAESIHALKGALDRMGERDRRVIRLREFEEREYAEVAEVMGLPTADAARKLHARALERLRETLEAEGMRA